MLGNSLLTRAKLLEKKMSNFPYKQRVHFYNSEEEYLKAMETGEVSSHTISFIDDISE